MIGYKIISTINRGCAKTLWAICFCANGKLIRGKR